MRKIKLGLLKSSPLQAHFVLNFENCESFVTDINWFLQLSVSSVFKKFLKIRVVDAWSMKTNGSCIFFSNWLMRFIVSPMEHQPLKDLVSKSKNQVKVDQIKSASSVLWVKNSKIVTHIKWFWQLSVYYCLTKYLKIRVIDEPSTKTNGGCIFISNCLQLFIVSPLNDLHFEVECKKSS